MRSFPERLQANVAARAGTQVAERVLVGCEPIASSAAGRRKAAWVSELLQRLDAEVSARDAAAILEACGRECISRNLVQAAKELRARAESLEAFLETLNGMRAGGGHLRLDGDVIRGRYDRCYCSWVNADPSSVPDVYCNCSVGWLKELFEGVFGAPVQVELTKTVVRGDDCCEYVVKLPHRPQ
jgi:predicted hydrocarbon binding protein